MKNSINSDNWTFCHYKLEQVRSKIYLAGDESGQILYTVVTFIQDDKDLMQKDFLELGQACDFINERYGNWDLIDETLRADEGGCNSCIAH